MHAEITIDDNTAAAHVERLRAQVNDALSPLMTEAEPDVLYAPARYVLDGGGKRLRPVLLLLVAEAFDVELDEALPAALAVELFHNFTLVHDDIMDHADTRRGRPTVQVRWNQGTAILTGDLLFARSYALLGRIESTFLPELMHVFSSMVERLCKGQALDKAFETQVDVSVQDYLQMIDHKTGALLQAAFELGGLLGEASDAQRAALREAGRQVGRAFQINDDLLDLTADHERWGKQVGGDLIEGKKTFLLLRALECAAGAERSWFARIIDEGGLSPDDIPEARDRMARLGVFDDARDEVQRYSEAAQERLAMLPSVESVDTLRWLIHKMQTRLH